MPYVKLDTGILDSTLWWSSADTCKVFITMLAMAHADGMVEATAPGIANRANMGLDAVRAALDELESPDPDSRTTADEGRRVRRVEGGYQIINYDLYRNKDHTAAERQRRFRQRQRERREQGAYVTRDTRDTPGQITNVTRDVTEAEAEADTEEPSNARARAREEDSATVAEIPLKDGTRYAVTVEQRDHWQRLFPSVNVALSLGAMRAWCESNPGKRKTRRGVTRFITGWLTRDMSEGRNQRAPDTANGARGGQPAGRRAPPEGGASVDADGADGNDYGGSSDEAIDAFDRWLRDGGP